MPRGVKTVCLALVLCDVGSAAFTCSKGFTKLDGQCVLLAGKYIQKFSLIVRI
jgi:hypothetical protein